MEEIRHRIILEHCEKSDNDMMKENKKDGTIAVWKHKYTKKLIKMITKCLYYCLEFSARMSTTSSILSVSVRQT